MSRGESGQAPDPLGWAVGRPLLLLQPVRQHGCCYSLSTMDRPPAAAGRVARRLLGHLGEPGALTPMNFRVSAQFHREFKLYAVQHGMSMVDLLQESFRLLKEQRAR